MGPIPPIATSRRNNQSNRRGTGGMPSPNQQQQQQEQQQQQQSMTSPTGASAALSSSAISPDSSLVAVAPSSLEQSGPSVTRSRMSLFGSSISTTYQNTTPSTTSSSQLHHVLTSSQSVDSILTAVNSNPTLQTSKQTINEGKSCASSKVNDAADQLKSMPESPKKSTIETSSLTGGALMRSGPAILSAASTVAADDNTTMVLMERGEHPNEETQFETTGCEQFNAARGTRNYPDQNNHKHHPSAETDSDGGEDNGSGFPLLTIAQQPHARRRRESSNDEEHDDHLVMQPTYDQDVMDQLAEQNRRILNSDCEEEELVEGAAEVLYTTDDCDDPLPTSSNCIARHHTRRNLTAFGEPSDDGLINERFMSKAAAKRGAKVKPTTYGASLDDQSEDEEDEQPERVDELLSGSPNFAPYGTACSRPLFYPSQQHVRSTKYAAGPSTAAMAPIKRLPLQPLHNAAAVARGSATAAHDQAQGTVSSSRALAMGIGPNLGWQATKTTLKDRLLYVFCNEALSDVHFIVGRGDLRQRIPAHKFLLSTGSAVFDAMFNGAFAADTAGNGGTEIELPDVEPAAFMALLRFLYSDDVTIGPESVMTTLYTAKKYAVPALENACVDFLKRNLSPDNAFMLLTQARLFDEPQLAALCLEIIDKNTTDALSAEGFAEIDLETLCAVLERDTLRVREAPLFHAIVRWATEECHRQQFPVTPDNQRTVLGRALGMIRFPLMTVEEFAQNAAQTRILSDREVVNLFLYFTVNPKPSVGFLDVPRCCVVGKEQVVSRFQRIEGRWGYSGTPDRIKFTVDRRIFVVGFGLYGSIHGPTEYQAGIQIIHCGTGKVLASNETTFQCDGSSTTFRVLFKEPVEITPSVTYIASACLKGPDSHYGTKGLRRIVHQSPANGCVTFQFTYAAGNNNGTSVEDGQIPEIIFYSKMN